MERIFPDLDLRMYVMVSAPTMPNGIADWAGYMSFIEHPDADLWWEEASPRAMVDTGSIACSTGCL